MRVCLLLCVAVLLTGCDLSLAVDLVVDADGGGVLAVSVTTDADLEEAAQAAGADPLGRAAERVRALDGPWDVSDEVDEDSGARTLRVSRGFDDPAAFATAYEELRAALDAPEARLLGPLALVVDEEAGLIRVEGELPLEVREPAAAELGTDPVALTAQLEGVVSSTLTLETPGAVVSTSAAQVAVDGAPEASPYPADPAVLTWTAGVGQVTPVAAVFEPGGPDLTAWLTYGGIGLLAVLLVAGGVLAQRRR